jgi:uncharacterized protein (DUF305 family)
MRLSLVPLALLLAACGSNVPPSAAGNLSMQALNLPAPTGNQDRDYARTMIVYHQGAMDMARRQVARGSDAGLRRQATEALEIHERQIGELQAYLERTGGR